jgi:hypothetical protein
MINLRLLLLSLSTLFSVAVPVTVSACGMPGEDMGGLFMATPVSMRGQFIFVNRVSRRTLRHAVAEQQQAKAAAPLVREIL